ncbi:unnamed protein product [Arctogadus glacialis]
MAPMFRVDCEGILRLPNDNAKPAQSDVASFSGQSSGRNELSYEAGRGGVWSFREIGAKRLLDCWQVSWRAD